MMEYTLCFLQLLMSGVTADCSRPLHHKSGQVSFVPSLRPGHCVVKLAANNWRQVIG